MEGVELQQGGIHRVCIEFLVWCYMLSPYDIYGREHRFPWGRLLGVYSWRSNYKRRRARLRCRPQGPPPPLAPCASSSTATRGGGCIAVECPRKCWGLRRRDTVQRDHGKMTRKRTGKGEVQ
eukprot:gene13539-biopygen503